MREVNGMREDHFFAEPIVESKGHKLAPSDTTLTIQSQNGPIKRSRFAGRGGGGFSDFFGVFHILCVAMGAAAPTTLCTQKNQACADGSSDPQGQGPRGSTP